MLRSGGAIGIYTVLQYAMAIGSQVVLARLLAPEVFGQFAFVLLVHGVFANLRNFNGPDFLVAYRGKDVDRAYATVFTFDLVLSSLTAVAAVLLARPIMEIAGRPGLDGYFAWMAPALVFMALSTPLAMLQRELDFARATIPGIVGVLVGPVVKIALAWWGFGIYSLLWGELIRQAIVVVLVFAVCPARPSLGIDPRIVRRAVAFGIPTTAASLMVYYYWKLDDYFVGVYLGDEMLGFYFLAFRIPEYMFNLRLAMSPLVYAGLCELSAEDRQREGFEILTHLTMVVTGLPTLLCVLYGDTVLTTVFGDRWRPAVAPFQFLMVATAWRMSLGYMADIVKSRGRTWLLPIATFQNALVLTVSVWYLTGRYGIAGTGAGVLVTVLASIPLTILYARMLLGMNPLVLLIRPVLCGGLATLAGVALLGVLPGGTLSHALQGLAVSLLYLGLLRLLDPTALSRLDRVLGRQLAPGPPEGVGRTC